MRIADFTATPDLVGRRVRISWSFEPEPGETLADVPQVCVRRKLRDFEFPPPGSPDPSLVYDANLFPPVPMPGAVTVTDLDTWEVVQPGLRTSYEPISVATAFAGRMVETLRRTVGTTYDENGVAVRQHVELLDLGGAPGALLPGAVYYYQIFKAGQPPSSPGREDAHRATALVTDSYGTNRAFYDSLPAIYRRHDVIARPPTPGADSVPEAAPLSGQLRRLTDLFGITLDALRGSADGLRTLHDIDNVDARFLPQLAAWIGWDLVGDVAVPLLRNEIKAASRLDRVVGTIPGLRVLTSQYTGWFTQVAEFAEHIARANQPARRNLMAVAERGGSWSGADDAAFALGLVAPNAEAAGSGGAAAVLVGTKTGPFTLRPGMVLSLAVDGMAPAAVRLGAGDFANPAAATADEIAAAIGRVLPEAQVDVAGGRVRIASRSTGAQSTLAVVQAPASLVSIESAAGGRLSTTVDKTGRQRVFYEAWESPAATSNVPASDSTVGSTVIRRVRYKTLEGAMWRDSHPIFEARPDPHGEPAAAVLSDDRVFAAWLDQPQTVLSRLRAVLGTSRPEQPARIAGLRVQPFRLVPNSVLTLVGDFAGSDAFTVRPGDFVDVTRATALEVVTAMNAQLTRVKATRAKNGSIALETVQPGPRARLSVDLRHSTTALALGFDRRNAGGTSGSWDETIDWSAALDMPTFSRGRHAELCAAVEPAGGARVVFSTHVTRRWRVAEVRWDERVLIATASGLGVSSPGAVSWQTLGVGDGLPSADVRAAALDADGTLWIATSAGVAVRPLAGTTTRIVKADGLPSADIRAIALAPDGSAWIATAAGVFVRNADGTSSVVDTGSGLPSNNVRAVAVTHDGCVWFATDNGAAMRSRDGVVRVFKKGDGLPSNDVRAIAIGPGNDGNLALGTTGGLALGGASGRFKPFDVSNGLPNNDVRAIAWDAEGALWTATARGVVAITPALVVSIILDSRSGLSGDDTRALAIAPDGAVWIGAAGGVDVRQSDGQITRLVAAGLPAGDVRAVAGFCSPPRELASTGASSREPCLVVDEQQRTWVIWSERTVNAEDDTWSLRARIFNPATASWGAPFDITTPPVGVRAADRTPSAIRVTGGVRVFFSSDRSGGVNLYSVSVTRAGVASAPVALPEQPSSETAPAPLVVGGETWLVFRSDASVSLAELAPPGASAAGRRLPDAGTLRRMAGTTSLVPGDVPRARLSRAFGDLWCYTPQKPLGAPRESPLIDDELYTRGTVGLYVSRGPNGDPITPSEIGRLRELLARLLPINMRAVVVIVPSMDVDVVYPAGTDIGESYHDDYPFPDVLGPITDASAATLNEWTLAHANVPGEVTANPTDLKTLRRRTWFPPPQ